MKLHDERQSLRPLKSQNHLNRSSPSSQRASSPHRQRMMHWLMMSTDCSLQEVVCCVVYCTAYKPITFDDLECNAIIVR